MAFTFWNEYSKLVRTFLLGTFLFFSEVKKVIHSRTPLQLKSTCALNKFYEVEIPWQISKAEVNGSVIFCFHLATVSAERPVFRLQLPKVLLVA